MIVDLRSDTVTRPTRAMFEAAATAEIGDDVYGEDPTVQRLEQRAAELVGLEAGLYLPTATMANLCAIITHCARGERVICSSESHVYRYEAGSASALGSVVYNPLVPRADGTFDLDELAHALPTPDDPHFAPTGLFTFENTLARRGGVVLGIEHCQQSIRLAHGFGVPVHVDGARLFNAAAALDTTADRIVEGADSVQLCLSKGLAAPLGSLLCGSVKFVARARRIRKQLGGGMRQVGVVAAMGLVALDTMRDRLHDDHARARRLARALAESGTIDVVDPQSNIVLLQHRTLDSHTLIAKAAERGVRLTGIDERRARAVTHVDVDDAGIDHAIAQLRAIA